MSNDRRKATKRDPEKLAARHKRYREMYPEKDKATKRAWYDANKAKVLERAHQRWLDDPEKERQRQRDWKAANPEAARRNRARGRAKEDPLTKKEQGRRYREENPEKRRAHHALRRARLRGAYVEYVDPITVYDRDEGHCGICYQKVGRGEFEVDHVIPLALGGEHSYDNVQPAHPRCNRKKNARI